MTRADFSLAIIDEPQLLQTTVPFDPYVTNAQFTLFGFTEEIVKVGKRMTKIGEKAYALSLF